jgi:hypothetical protein
MDFDEFPSEITMNGNGAQAITQAPQMIWHMNDTNATERIWELSFWSYADNYKATLPVPRIRETDPEGKVISDTGLHRENVAWAESIGSWIQVALPLTTKGKGYRYELFIDSNGPVIDNLLLRPAMDTCMITLTDGTLFNNLPVHPE